MAILPAATLSAPGLSPPFNLSLGPQLDNIATLLIYGSYTSLQLAILGTQDGVNYGYLGGQRNTTGYEIANSATPIAVPDKSTLFWNIGVWNLKAIQFQVVSIGGGSVTVSGTSGFYFGSPFATVVNQVAVQDTAVLSQFAPLGLGAFGQVVQGLNTMLEVLRAQLEISRQVLLWLDGEQPGRVDASIVDLDV